MELPINIINIKLTEGVRANWQILTNNLHSFTQSVQQFGQSLKSTATQTTDQAINTVTKTLEDSWQTATQIKNTTSGTIENAITNSVNHLVTQYPAFLHFLQILGWASNHPIMSLIILLFIIALAWSIIKGIIRLIETASWSILKIPFKLIQTLSMTVLLSLTKFANLTFKKITYTHKNNYIPAEIPVEKMHQKKQQRLAEISHRLETIQSEQQQLLQEAANLIGSETADYRELTKKQTS